MAAGSRRLPGLPRSRFRSVGWGAWPVRPVPATSRSRHQADRRQGIDRGRDGTDRGRIGVQLATEVDHVMPKSKGGTDADSNLQSINRDCHKRKTIEEQGGIVRPVVRIGLDGYPIL